MPFAKCIAIAGLATLAPLHASCRTTRPPRERLQSGFCVACNTLSSWSGFHINHTPTVTTSLSTWAYRSLRLILPLPQRNESKRRALAPDEGGRTPCHAPVLESMVPVRLHLGECGEGNGALPVIPGTHRGLRIPEVEIAVRMELCASRVVSSASDAQPPSDAVDLLHRTSAPLG
jgi:hypothetical protein